MQKRQHARWSWLAAFAALAIVLTGAIAAGANAGKSAQGACATIDKYGVQKQTNVHAAQILAACGRSPFSQQQLDKLNLKLPAAYTSANCPKCVVK